MRGVNRIVQSRKYQHNNIHTPEDTHPGHLLPPYPLSTGVLYVDNLAVFPAKFRAMDFDHEYRRYYNELVLGEMRLGSSDSPLSIDINSLIYDGRFL